MEYRGKGDKKNYTEKNCDEIPNQQQIDKDPIGPTPHPQDSPTLRWSPCQIRCKSSSWQSPCYDVLGVLVGSLGALLQRQVLLRVLLIAVSCTARGTSNTPCSHLGKVRGQNYSGQVTWFGHWSCVGRSGIICIPLTIPLSFLAQMYSFLKGDEQTDMTSLKINWIWICYWDCIHHL